jgi:predicted ATPase
MRGEVAIADEVAGQLMTLAETTGETAVLLAAHNTAGMVRFYRGEFAAALEHCERAKAVYDPEQHRPNRLFSIDHDPGVSCMAHGALSLLMLGRPDRAATRMRECLEYAHAIDHPLSVAMAYNFAATFHQFRREPLLVQELEDVRLEYSQKHDFDLFLLLGEIYRGWLVAEQGDREQGLNRIHQGLAAFQAIGAELGRPTFLGILATVCDELGRADDAWRATTDATALADQTGLHYWDAELQRLRGGLLLRPERGVDEQAAESCFLRAIEIARRQEGRWFELRAATSLARLWHRQGATKKARDLLATVVGWFTEGFATPDLIDATALLRELERAASKRRSR